MEGKPNSFPGVGTFVAGVYRSAMFNTVVEHTVRFNDAPRQSSSTVHRSQEKTKMLMCSWYCHGGGDRWRDIVGPMALWRSASLRPWGLRWK